MQSIDSFFAQYDKNDNRWHNIESINKLNVFSTASKHQTESIGSIDEQMDEQIVLFSNTNLYGRKQTFVHRITDLNVV